MAQITIQEVLGSDNVGATRSVFMANTKLLADGVNKIETYLNTTPNGGDLNIGNILIKKYNNTVSNEIFRCEASGRVHGNLTVLKGLSVGTGNIGEVSNFLSDVSIGRVLNVSRSLNSSNATNLSAFNAGVTIGDIFALEASMVWGVEYPVVDMDVLGFNTTGTGKNNITFDWAGSTVDAAGITSGYEGQLLIIKNKGVRPSTSLISIQSGGIEIVRYTNITSDAILANIITTLIFVATNPSVSKTVGLWKVLNYVAPTGTSVVLA